MSTPATYLVRAAGAADAKALLLLWASVFDEDDADPAPSWQRHAQQWFTRSLEEGPTTCLPVVEVGGAVVATAIGTLELGVPNPHCPRGRAVRLANVVTAPEHRGRGYGTLLVQEVVAWARSIEADRVDLSTTPGGRRIYEKAGFTLTKAPRMKMVL